MPIITGMSAQFTTRKRARAGSAGTKDREVHAETVKVEDENGARLGLHRDEEFWLDDGTVILVARDVEFRVYSGLLANHSPVFRELIAKPHSTRPVSINNNHEVFCPVVQLSDTPEDLRHLLRAYMSPGGTNFYDAKTPSFAAISASIRLGRKYHMTTLYEESLRYLKSYYTSCFENWIDHQNWVPEGWQTVEVIGVVNLARLTREHSLLPTALLDCTTVHGEELVHGFTREDGSQERLTLQDLGLCFNAKSAIRKASIAVFLRTLPHLASWPRLELSDDAHVQGDDDESRVWPGR
ncbi:hypothetical protein C8Q74DRAFT_330652 [Fomes fomentarius]|nr:hypothetical protein C8Q74DRAFT_330652 [Fomes fomentarius]